MLVALVNISAHLKHKLLFLGCNIETTNLKFDSGIKFTLPWISFVSCYGSNGETSGLNKELEDIVEAISNSKLKDSLSKFNFSDEGCSITEEEVEGALKNKGIDHIEISQ